MSLDIEIGKISDKSNRKKGVVVEAIINLDDSLSDKQIKDLIKNNIKPVLGESYETPPLKDKVFDYLHSSGLFGGSEKDMEKGIESYNEEENQNFTLHDHTEALWDDFELSLEGVEIIENTNGKVKVELRVCDEILRGLNKSKKKSVSR